MLNTGKFGQESSSISPSNVWYGVKQGMHKGTLHFWHNMLLFLSIFVVGHHTYLIFFLHWEVNTEKTEMSHPGVISIRNWDISSENSNAWDQGSNNPTVSKWFKWETRLNISTP